MDTLVRVLLVEDEHVIRQGLAELLNRQPGITVAASVCNTADAMAVLDADEAINVVVSDVMLGESPAGLDLLGSIRSRADGPPVLLLSSYGEPWLYSSALRAGALGYVLKGASLSDLLSAIRSVSAGVAVFPGAAIRDRFSPRAPSAREREIMRLVADGYGNGEIGGRLGIKEKTVESHLTRLFARYSVGTRTQLAMLAAKQGWIGKRTIGAG
jgi:DNA-binding NarL/FixJ family response regulator